MTTWIRSLWSLDYHLRTFIDYKRNIILMNQKFNNPNLRWLEVESDNETENYRKIIDDCQWLQD